MNTYQTHLLLLHTSQRSKVVPLNPESIHIQHERHLFQNLDIVEEGNQFCWALQERSNTNI